MHLSKKTGLIIGALLLSLLLFAEQKQEATASAESEPAETNAISEAPWTINTSPISQSGQKASVPSLAVGPDGTLHTAFKQGNIASTTANEAYYSFSVDDGATWAVPQAIFIDPFAFVVDKVDIAVSNNGTVHAMWIERHNSNLTYTLYYSSNSNGTWSDPEIVEQVGDAPDDARVLDQPSMAVTNSQVYVSWTNTSRIRFAARANGTWSTPQEIGRSELPEIAIDGSGNLHLVYLESQDTLVARYTQSNDGGANWSNDIGISATNKDVKDIDLVIDGSTIHVAFGASLVIGGAIDPISSTPIIDPYHTSCSTDCTNRANWRVEDTATSVQSGNAPADAILLVPSIETIAPGAVMIFYHGVLQENVNFEQVLGVCYQPNQGSSKNYKLPTTFARRMVKPQIEFVDGTMHMVYEQVEGQTTSTDFQEVFYAQLDVSCYDIYLPFITRND